MQTRQASNGAVVAGILLIVLGLVFFAAMQGWFELDWGNLWPIFPMLVGAGIIAMAFTIDSPGGRAGAVIGGTIPLLVGAFFFAVTMGAFEWGDMGTLWPVFPIIVGLSFLAGYFAGGREQPGLLWPAGIIGGVGVIFLLITTSSVGYGIIGQLWPLLLIAIGVMLLIPRIWRTNRE